MNNAYNHPSLSEEGKSLLSDPAMYYALRDISERVNSTPEEFLFRFEEALRYSPEKIFCIFEQRTV